MARQGNIRWNSRDKESMTNLVKQFNKKVRDISKNEPDIADYLPKQITSRSLKQQIKSRADFNRVIKEHSKFLESGAEKIVQNPKGVTVTQWEEEKLGRQVGEINKQRKAERKRAKVSAEKGTLTAVERQNIADKKYNFADISSPKAWDKYVESVEKQIRSDYFPNKAAQYKKDYLRSIRRNLGYSKKANELYKLVQGLDAQMMYDSYYDDPVLQINYTSEPLDAIVIAETALENWQTHLTNMGGSSNGAA